MHRSATAIWNGNPDFGEGSISTATGAFDQMIYLPRYTPASGTETCTTPGELLAAAEAASVARWLAHELMTDGVTSSKIHATATVMAEDTLDGYIIQGIHLDIRAVIKPPDLPVLQQAAERARANAPVSRSLNVPVTLEVQLEQAAAAVAR